jgi:hypothetical protein
MCDHEWGLERQSFSRDYGDRFVYHCAKCKAKWIKEYDCISDHPHYTRDEIIDA